MSSALTPLLWLLAVVALIPLALWLLKRSPMLAAHANGPMRTVSVLPLSTSQRLVTVEVGRGEDRLWLVLGVTGQQISTLHTMAPQAPAPQEAGTPQTTFASLLDRMKGDTGGPHGR